MKIHELYDNLLAVVPDNWSVEKDSIITTVSNPTDGLGALQFTSFIVDKEKDVDLVEELFHLLEDKYDYLEVKLMGNHAFAEIIDECDIAWKYWLIKVEESIIFATYNCEVNDNGKEDDIVNHIINSIVQ